ncbi:pyridoxine/pyridoxamine 5'-phosphate oxidase [Fundicoccus sp. Sow4_H7]|uniref:pyridoxine/pyridoxamine 5'-phosphate oxidase n=1 Tax=Fundicoccus sp. Sow4_H7 TaxID=3438784 RepID=UPI003F8FC0E3
MEYSKKIKELKVLQGDKLKLDWENVGNNPSKLFYKWLDIAINYEVIEPQAMVLATADTKGFITSRVLLVRHVDEESNFYFSTSKANPAGEQLSENPNASLNFYWKELSQQIIVSGRVEKCHQTDSIDDFKKRSIGSKSICLVQKQSQLLENIQTMHLAVEETQKELKSNPDLINPNWSLFKVIPDKIEFFQGRKTRMHERLVFTRNSNNEWGRNFIWA